MEDGLQVKNINKEIQNKEIKYCLQVTLLSLEGSGCVSDPLDDPTKVDYFQVHYSLLIRQYSQYWVLIGQYFQGQEARFDSVEVGLAGCAGATLEGGPIGGSVMWTGQVIQASH